MTHMCSRQGLLTTVLGLLVTVAGGTPAGASPASDVAGLAPATFATSSVFRVGKSPIAAAVADVNRDGHLDVVTANSLSQDVTTLLGDGHGHFTPDPAGPLRLGFVPFDLALADVNGDGMPDLLVDDAVNNAVRVFLGDGRGGFVVQHGHTLHVGSDPGALAVADLNGDGHPDVATADTTAPGVSILINAGDGRFERAHTIHLAFIPHHLMIADLTGNGYPDLIVAGGDNRGGVVQVLLGDGHGGFTPDRFGPIRPAVLPTALGALDANGDGHLDIAVAGLSTSDQAGSSVAIVLLGDGSGRFASGAHVTVSRSSAAQISSLVGGDVNGDGHADLSVGLTVDDEVRVFHGDGRGHFAAGVDIPVGQDPAAIAIADVNGDGHPDLVAANSSDDTVSVVLGHGPAGFQSARAYATATLQPTSLWIGDLNGDGHPDIVTGSADGGCPGELLGAGHGRFVPVSIPIPREDCAGAVAVADVDRDGHPDLLFAESYLRTLRVLFGDGRGRFTMRRSESIPLGVEPSAMATADVNGDAHAVAILASAGDSALVVLQNISSGHVKSNTYHHITVGWGPMSLAVADVNGDGYPDIVVVGSARTPSRTERLTLLLGNRRGGFALAPGGPSTVRLSGSALAVADLNRDGRPDVAVTGPHGISILLGDGHGHFAPTAHGPYHVGNDPSSVAVADLNGDGFPDLITGGGDNVSVLLGNGRGGFTADLPLSFDAGGSPDFVAATDVNGDGKPDVIAANDYDRPLDETGNSVTVLLNTTPARVSRFTFQVSRYHSRSSLPVASTARVCSVFPLRLHAERSAMAG